MLKLIYLNYGYKKSTENLSKIRREDEHGPMYTCGNELKEMNKRSL